MDDTRPAHFIADNRTKRKTYRLGRKMLADTFPRTFSQRGQPKRPLAFGVKRKLLEAAAEGGIELTPAEVAAIVSLYCSSKKYLEAMVPGAARICLDGLAHGLVDEEAARRAREKMAKKGWLV